MTPEPAASPSTDAPLPRRTNPTVDAIVRGIRVVLAPVASLKITVVLFALAILLVFFGTLAQTRLDIWQVIDKYFYSYGVTVYAQGTLDFLKVFGGIRTEPTLPPGGGLDEWAFAVALPYLWFPLPGGLLLGWAMFANLCFAHVLQLVNLIDGVRKQTARTRSTAADILLTLLKRTGIFILHGGVSLLLVGEFITRQQAVEQQMSITEGGTNDTTVDTRYHELAFIDRSGATLDRVTAVKLSVLRSALHRGQPYSHPDLPFDIEPLQVRENVKLAPPPESGNPATAGFGVKSAVVDIPLVSAVEDTNERNTPAVYVRLVPKDDAAKSQVYLFTPLLKDQTIEVGGKKLAVALQNVLYPKPYSLTLNEFTFEQYTGTNKAKNYASHLTLSDPDTGVSRDVVVSMNHPLRYRGETYYQSQFNQAPTGQKTTVLQVVKNPAWTFPYIACALVAGGMTVHFLIVLVHFLGRVVYTSRTRRDARTASVDLTSRRTPLWQRLLAPACGLLAAVVVFAAMSYPKRPTAGRLDLSDVATIPVHDGGRVKPLDTVARVDLRLLTHGEDVSTPDGTKWSAVRWFMETASRTPAVDRVDLFRSQNDQVNEELKLKPRSGFRYSYREIEPGMDALKKLTAQFKDIPSNKQDVFQRKTLELATHISVSLHVAGGDQPLVVPPHDDLDWRSFEAARKDARDRSPTLPKALEELGVPQEFARADAPPEVRRRAFDLLEGAAHSKDDPIGRQLVQLIDRETTAEMKRNEPIAAAWSDVLDAYRDGDPEHFRDAVKSYRQQVDPAISPADRGRVKLEEFMNRTGLYYACTVAYGVAAVVGLVGFALLLVAPTTAGGIRRGVCWLLLATFLVHTLTLVVRMVLMDRAFVFVTNLYSSAMYIGWAVAGLCLLCELLYPIGLANVIAGAVGFGTSIIAHNLAASGDTLEMMQAVLDTNFWLATHVTCVTLGYAATYLAGLLGLALVVLQFFPPKAALERVVTVGGGVASLKMELGKLIGKLLYGVLCLATLLSFTGTVLGGIWADQSWGRFWGWDPKENGAVLIVVWNVLILHARWAGLVKEKGTAVLALAGNMIVTWSWFGTNQLGVGLHAYGFSNDLVNTCKWLWGTHALAIGFGVLPWRWIWGVGQTEPPLATRVVSDR